MKTLLINYVYYPPVGHLLEVIKHARGYYEANKDLKISILVNSETPIELAEACDWIEAVYPISIEEVLSTKVGEEAPCVMAVPKDWDYVLVDSRTKDADPVSAEDSVAICQIVLQRVFMGKEWTASTPRRPLGLDDCDVSKEQVIPYKLNAHIDIPVPAEAQEFVKKYLHDGPVITILPSGSAGDKQSPSLKLWEEICLALSAAIPTLKINFTGVTKSEKGRTTTQDIKTEDIDALVSRLPNAENCFNIGLWNQIALIETSDIYCSPHSGFSFIAPAVGTPWLAISGCPWPEYFFNDTKFYSVLPDCESYPSKGEVREGCGKLLAEGRKSICMQDDNLRKKIPEIVNGAQMLLDDTFTYDKAIELHLGKIRKNDYDFFFFDGVRGIKGV